MPPLKHAKLSPSASKRWLSCPASIRMENVFPIEEIESPYAIEGTAAHALAEIIARRDLLGEKVTADAASWGREFPEYIDDEDMDRHAHNYVEFLRERIEAHEDPVLFLEQRLDTGVPTCWGTSDAVIVGASTIEIVDLKYGQGVPVPAEENPQLRLYALGALDAYDGLYGDIETVTMTIYQPRLNSFPVAEISAADLRAWREEIIPVAESALGPDAPFGPSEEACRWCPLSGRCRAQLENLALTDFAEDPEVLSPEEVAEALGKTKMIRDYLLALERHALQLAYNDGVPLPGWKVVSSGGGRRSIPDQEGAILHLTTYVPAGRDEPLDTEEFATLKLKGIGELEKLLGGRAGFDEALSTYVTKSEGRPSLVPESDRRKSIDPNTEAQKDFLVLDPDEL